MKAKAYIYYHPVSAYEAKELAGRVRADGALAILVDGTKFRGAKSDVPADADALILDQDLGNCATIIRAHSTQPELHYVKKENGRYEFVDQEAPSDAVVSEETDAAAVTAGAPDNPELATAEKADAEPESEEI